jgi:short subunit dehydrogenase-like uncharacterized protein
MAAAKQAGPIAVYGATGFTGRLVAQELKRREADIVVAGRSRDQLEALSAELGGVPIVTAALEDDDALRSMLEPCAAVVACAGPFGMHGEPVLAAAAETGTHYLDTTGEQAFMRMVFDRYGARAKDTGAALVAGRGFSYGTADLIAALTAAGIGPLDEIVLAFWVRGFRPTHGTARATIETIRGEAIEWRGGGWRPQRRSLRGRWHFPAPAGEQRMLSFPAIEQVTLPRHIETNNVRTLLSASTMVPRRLMPLLPLAMPAIELAMQTPLHRAVGALISRMLAGPSEDERREARFMVVCEARAGSRVRRGWVSGADPYGLTAATTSQGALLVADPSFDRTGALAPAEAFEPRAFLDALADSGVTVEVAALRESA